MERKAAIIDRSTLEAAFSYNARGHRSYLDLQTGRVLAVKEGELRDAALLQRLADEPDRFIAIEPVPPSDQHRWMTDFVASIADLELRERLTRALDGTGAFRRFKDLLRTDAAARRRWFILRSALVSSYMEAWLLARGIPDVLTAAAPPAPEAPTDDPAQQQLRAAARAQIDRLPDDALRLAVDYLRHRL